MYLHKLTSCRQSKSNDIMSFIFPFSQNSLSILMPPWCLPGTCPHTHFRECVTLETLPLFHTPTDQHIYTPCIPATANIGKLIGWQCAEGYSMSLLYCLEGTGSSLGTDLPPPGSHPCLPLDSHPLEFTVN